MINKFIGIGNLTKDPETRELGEYLKCSFPIAINSTKDEVIFLDVEAWGKTAENCKKYLTKGSQVYIEGKIKINKYKHDHREMQIINHNRKEFRNMK